MLAYYDRYWNSKWSSSIGYSFTEVDNTKFQDPGAFKKIDYASGNLLYYPAENLMLGGELMWGERRTTTARRKTTCASSSPSSTASASALMLYEQRGVMKTIHSNSLAAGLVATLSLRWRRRSTQKGRCRTLPSRSSSG